MYDYVHRRFLRIRRNFCDVKKFVDWRQGMLDKRKIRLMSRMAMYEKHYIREDMRISSYYKKDYSSLNTLISILWVTIGYIIIAGIIALINMEVILEDLTIQKMVFLVGAVALGYIIVLIIYGFCASSFYKNKHTKAKQRVKRYYRDLTRLGKVSAKEKNKR